MKLRMYVAVSIIKASVRWIVGTSYNITCATKSNLHDYMQQRVSRKLMYNYAIDSIPGSVVYSNSCGCTI